ncbi:hypothetical protein D9757_011684 [Collybiopsis confluens]|uniref:Uncharacterized protein n=1 Tax=Collybiopsis confluens TaxID=2823264 RepID=A0A8H5LRV8_9AGAR|nr:hypothetical protein D9757_011684 [Collybiopsis confluens]
MPAYVVLVNTLTSLNDRIKKLELEVEAQEQRLPMVKATNKNRSILSIEKKKQQISAFRDQLQTMQAQHALTMSSPLSDVPDMPESQNVALQGKTDMETKTQSVGKESSMQNKSEVNKGIVSSSNVNDGQSGRGVNEYTLGTETEHPGTNDDLMSRPDVRRAMDVLDRAIGLPNAALPRSQNNQLPTGEGLSDEAKGMMLFWRMERAQQNKVSHGAVQDLSPSSNLHVPSSRRSSVAPGSDGRSTRASLSSWLKEQLGVENGRQVLEPGLSSDQHRQSVVPIDTTLHVASATSTMPALIGNTPDAGKSDTLPSRISAGVSTQHAIPPTLPASVDNNTSNTSASTGKTPEAGKPNASQSHAPSCSEQTAAAGLDSVGD